MWNYLFCGVCLMCGVSISVNYCEKRCRLVIILNHNLIIFPNEPHIFIVTPQSSLKTFLSILWWIKIYSNCVFDLNLPTCFIEQYTKVTQLIEAMWKWRSHHQVPFIIGCCKCPTLILSDSSGRPSRLEVECRVYNPFCKKTFVQD